MSGQKHTFERGEEGYEDTKGFFYRLGVELLKYLTLASFFLFLIGIDLMANQWNWF